MTVAALPSVANYIENGVTTSFPVPFRFKAAEHLAVTRIMASGAVALLSYGVDYAVVGGATDAGGTVTVSTASTAGTRLIIRRRTPRAQPMNYTAGDRFPAISHEEALDQGILITQEIDAAVTDQGARALSVPVGEIAAPLPPRAQRTGLAAWDDASGSLIGIALLPGLTGASPIICASRVVLRAVALPSNGQPITLSEAGRAGGFIWRAGSRVADVAADPGQGVYIPTAADPTGATGAWVRSFSGDISPMWFGAIGDNIADDALALNRAGAMAIRVGKFLDLTEAPTGWRVAAEIDWTGLPGLKAVFDRPISVDLTGVYPRGFGVMFGNPSVAGGSGRSDKLQLIGNLSVFASSRATGLHGVFMKGAFMNIGAIYVNGFNGIGFNGDSIWDSKIDRVSVQRCGNITWPSVLLASNGDTTNATHIVSLQCEEAYHKGIFANLLRYVIHNIHTERLAVLTTNESGSGTYNNHYFLVSQGTIGQVVFTALPTGTNAPDGSVIASPVMRITMAGGACAFEEVHAEGHDVTCDFGNQITFRTLLCRNYSQTSGVDTVEIDNPFITGTCAAERGLTLDGGSVGTFAPLFNARDQVVNRTTIVQPLNFPNNILGDITIRDAKLAGVQNTRAPAAGYKSVLLDNCSAPTMTGAFDAMCRVRGGSYGAVVLASQAKFDLDHVEIDSFDYVGNTGFLTRGCRAKTVIKWAAPVNVAYPAGTLTERLGYTAGVTSIYRQTDIAVGGGTTWTAIA